MDSSQGQALRPTTEANRTGEEGIEEGDKVTVEIASLPSGATKDDIEQYFEAQGEEVEVLSAVILGDGNGQIELSGLTAEEIERMKKKRHKIKRQVVSIKFQLPPPSPTLPEPMTDTKTDSEAELSILEASGLPADIDEETLTMYFETSRAGGCSGAVEECSFTTPDKSTARVKFKSPEVTAQILSKVDHTIFGARVQLQYVTESSDDQQEEPAQLYEENKLVIPQVPSGVSEDIIGMVIEITTGLELGKDFTLESVGSSAIITFLQDHSTEELKEMITKIRVRKVRGACLEAELCKVSTSIRVSNITKHYDDEFIKIYFEHPRSGGGEVTSVELLGNGEAMVTFEDPTVIKGVLKVSHTAKLGENVTVQKSSPFSIQPISPPDANPASAAPAVLVTPRIRPPLRQPLEIPVIPLIAKALHNAPELEKCVQNLHIQISVDKDQNVVQAIPTQRTPIGWETECQQQIQSLTQSCKKTTLEIPQQAVCEVVSALNHAPQQSLLAYELSQDNILTVFGDPSTTSTLTGKVETICSTHLHTEENVTLNPDEYEFVSKLKRAQIAKDHPDVQVEFATNHTLIVKGSAQSVQQFQQSLKMFTTHATIPVHLDPHIVQYLSTEDGREQLNRLIQEKSLPIAAHFTQAPNSQPVLQFLCDPANAGHAQSLSSMMMQSTRVDIHFLTDPFLSMLPDLQDYEQFCQELERQQHVKITTANQRVTIAGFSQGVFQSKQEIVNFIQKKTESLMKPLEIKVEPLIAKSLHKSLAGLQSNVQSLHVHLTVDTMQGVIRVMPVSASHVKTQWREECHKQVSSYIKSTYVSAELEIPRQALTEVNSLLFQMEGSTPLACTFREDRSILTAIGDKTTISDLKEKVMSISSRYIEAKEELALSLEEYVFITTLQQSKLATDHPNLIIHYKPADHMLSFQGSVWNVNQFKQSIPKYKEHITVLAQLDPHIIEYLFTQDGRKQLDKFIREKQCPVAVYSPQESHSQPMLLLLCEPVHKGIAKALANDLQKATAVETFFPSGNLATTPLSEFEGFAPLCQDLQTRHWVQITVLDQSAKIVGFTHGVKQTSEALHSFFQEVHTSLQPLQIPINPLVAKFLSKNPDILRRSIQSLPLALTVDKEQGAIRVVPTQYMKAGWKQNCQLQITSFVDSNYAQTELRIPQQAASDIMPLILSAQEAVCTEYDGPVLKVAGECSTIRELESKIEQILPTKEKVALTPQEYEFVSTVKVMRITADHPDMVIKFNSTNHTLELQGSVRSVNNFKVSSKKYSTHHSVPVHIDPLLVEHFSKEVGKQQLRSFVQGKDSAVTVYYDHSSRTQLLLCDPNNTQSAKRLAQAIGEATLVQSTQLPGSFKPDMKYYEECRRIEKQHSVYISTSAEDKHVKLAGFKREVSQANNSLRKYINEKCSMQKQIEIMRGVWRLFSHVMKRKWDSVVAQCQQKGVKVIPPPDDDASKLLISDENVPNLLITLEGEKSTVENMYIVIAKLAQSVITRQVQIFRPGICKCFREPKTQMMLCGIETCENVTIELVETSITPEDTEPAAGIYDSSGAVKLCVAAAGGGKNINIYVGDITEFNKADVIVNAANERLEHYGGLAQAISQKGGPVIQDESRKYVRSNGPLDAGDVWLTTRVGSLPCRALIHTVGPRWNRGTCKEEAYLERACENSLTAARRYNSIAFPALSAGFFHFPLDLCADTLIKTALEYFKNNPYEILQEIYFVLHTQGSAQAFVDAAKRILPPQNITTFAVPKPQQSFPKAAHLPAMAVTPPKKEARPAKKKTTPALSTPPSDFIKLQKGSLLDVQADVYVNTTNSDLNLLHGAVAQLLSRAAGRGLQAECKTKAPVSPGDIAVTSAGELPSQYIFHVVVPNYDGPGKKAEKALKDVMRKCLKECSKKQGVSSIAFPAIGTGNLSFPSDVVAKIMLGEAFSFLTTNKSTQLKTVHFVIFMLNTYQAFQRELQSKTLTSHPVRPSSPSQELEFEDDDDDAEQLAEAIPQGVHNGQTFEVSGLPVQVVTGDITNDDSDALVNTTNTRMQLAGSRVAAAFLHKGGQHLQNACDQLVSQGKMLEEGKVLVTPATGKLNCKSVFHIVFESRDPKKFMKIITACLQKAEELQYKSIAFPAIGTGMQSFPAEDAAKGMIKAIHQFASSKPTHISDIRVVVFQADVHQAFFTTFSAQAPLKPAGILQRAIHYVGSWWGSSSKEDCKAGLGNGNPTKEEHKNLEVRIHGATEESVAKAENIIDTFIEDQCVTMKVPDPHQVDDSELDASKLADGPLFSQLQAKAHKLQVRMEYQKPPLNYFRLKGEKADVTQMRAHIIEAFAAVQKQDARKREATHVQKLIQWKHQGLKEATFDREANYEIERAYEQQRPTFTYNKGSQHFTIDFGRMEVTDHASSETHKVARTDLIKEGEVPPAWDPMPLDPTTNKEKVVHEVPLKSDSEEYQKVLTHFNQTMGRYNTIVSISRIQNPMQHAQYRAKKKDMDKHNPPGHENERFLFHGTSADSVPKINTQSFNRSFAGQNATVYGRGVYFARDASYSAQSTYSPSDGNGHKRMYLARVLTGEFTVGNSTMLVPPAKNPQNPNILFDSVVNNVSIPQIFVVFHDSLAYPEYLIVFN